MSDERIRAAERRYADEGSLEALGDLEELLRRADQTHPDAVEERLKLGSRLALVVARRHCDALASSKTFGFQSALATAQNYLYLCGRRSALHRKMENGGHNVTIITQEAYNALKRNYA